MENTKTNLYDIVIIGGGPAGAAATVYSARKQLKTLIIVAEWGGQSQVSETIYNWIGNKAISGMDLANNLRDHALSYVGEYLDSIDGQKVVKIEKNGKSFVVTTDDDKTFNTKTILIASGSRRRKLNAINADKFEHKGITYCATCDGPVFADQDVVVIGGGNAGFESALQLSAYCKSVTILHHTETFKADAITVEKALAKPNIKAITNAETIRVDGGMFVDSLTYKDKNTDSEHTLATTGVFVEIGQISNTDFVKDLVDTSPSGDVIVDPRNQRASVDGIWAAGDCTNGLYHQNNIAAGDAIKALEDIYMYVHTKY